MRIRGSRSKPGQKEFAGDASRQIWGAHRGADSSLHIDSYYHPCNRRVFQRRGFAVVLSKGAGLNIRPTIRLILIRLGVGSDPPGKVPGPEGAQWHVPSSDNIVSVFFLSSAGADGGSGTSQEVDGVHSHMFLWSRICGGSRDGWVADLTLRIVFLHCRRRGYPEWIHIPAVRWMVACT